MHALEIEIFCYVLVACTNCNLSDFISNKQTMISSERLKSYDVNIPIYELFYKIIFIDSTQWFQLITIPI